MAKVPAPAATMVRLSLSPSPSPSPSPSFPCSLSLSLLRARRLVAIRRTLLASGNPQALHFNLRMMAVPIHSNDTIVYILIMMAAPIKPNPMPKPMYIPMYIPKNLPEFPRYTNP